MSTLYVLGNLLGRAIVSYGLVWLVCWLFSRLDWRLAFRRSRRWYSVVAVVVLTLLGLVSAVQRAGGL
ncbi:hypothetical protein [Hydrogenophaga sp. PAMC20947]|uniref:hypothetical protein n=1 Tax=Hydrogenophaga sp. PAMC20947 TaxID=2565558 RepID=UPI00109E06D3|nr:hypothetical protein [Hydrogenophaga sp. PAMC20947]QCB47233.1 hypothetical protein E5678_15085 [Hydrogenophaga sp. PAMC20947]